MTYAAGRAIQASASGGPPTVRQAVSSKNFAPPTSLVGAAETSSHSTQHRGSIAPFENGYDRVDWISAEGMLVDMNEAGRRVLGAPIDQKRGLPWLDLWCIDSRGCVAGGLASARASGSTRFTAGMDTVDGRSWWDVVLCVVPTGFVAQARDVSVARAIVDEFQHRSRHDELTGLLNRAAFKETVSRQVAGNEALGRGGAVVMLDLDNFKMINDSMGHDVGDLTLQAVASALSAVVGDVEFSARLGGDEFAAVLPSVADLNALRGTIERLLQRIGRPIDVQGRTLTPRASIGVALFPKHGTTPADLLKHADIALYAAKSFGRGGYVVFVPSMRGPIRRRAAAAAAVRSALAENRIEAFYQPIVSLASNRLLGFETKLQVVLPDGAMLPAAEVDSVYDDVELAQGMGARILSRVTDDAHRWRAGGLALTHIAINACAAEFRSGDYARRFLAKIDEAKLPASLFSLEVAETVFAGRGTDYVAAALATLSSAGVLIALDEFGSGPASLSHLKRLPISGIKIDRSFVDGVEHDGGDSAIVRAIIGLANGLGIGLAVEGVSTRGQADTLTSFGCTVGQGDFFGPPAPASAASAMLGGALRSAINKE